MGTVNKDPQNMELCEELMALLEDDDALSHVGRRGSLQGFDEVSEDEIKALCRLWNEEESRP
jgi:hypothetical protein